MKKVRTRFAPSPTGYMHVGNLRTALFTYLIAKSNDGTFILRIEDTDLERQVEGALDIIYNTLDTVHLKYDEGPDIGGNYGPYIQTERKEIYQAYADILIEKGHGYHCFCTEERLNALREEQGKGFMYDRKCKSLSPDEIKEKLDTKTPFVIRQFIPDEGETRYTDLVYGEITFQNKELGDQILIKSDGLPTYNFANVVDDHLMEITHVVRGNEYLSSAPKYSILYDSFGWVAPAYVHLPLVLNESGEKLSKRRGDSTFEDLVEAGFLPEAILNFMALLGWSPHGEHSTEEFFTLEELVQVFDVAGVSKSPAIFDMNKLRWMNSEYFKRMDFDVFYPMAMPYLQEVVKKPVDYEALARSLQSRITFLTDINHMLDFVDTVPSYDISLYEHRKMKTTPQSAHDTLQAIAPHLESCMWDKESIHQTILSHASDNGLKNGQVMWPLRTAVSGKEETPMGAIDLLLLLGKEESLTRIETAIKLTAPSTK